MEDSNMVLALCFEVDGEIISELDKALIEKELAAQGARLHQFCEEVADDRASEAHLERAFWELEREISRPVSDAGTLKRLIMEKRAAQSSGGLMDLEAIQKILNESFWAIELAGQNGVAAWMAIKDILKRLQRNHHVAFFDKRLISIEHPFNTDSGVVNAEDKKMRKLLRVLSLPRKIHHIFGLEAKLITR